MAKTWRLLQNMLAYNVLVSILLLFLIFFCNQNYKRPITKLQLEANLGATNVN